MGTPATTPTQLNKVVVACRDGRRLKGFVYSFSPLKDSFQLLPEENPLQARGTKVETRDLKAIFFVKDFLGNREYQECAPADPPMHGRKIEVTFRDGEKIAGKTEGYSPQKLGFFMFPADPSSNNVRIFVVNLNTSQVKFV